MYPKRFRSIRQQQRSEERMLVKHGLRNPCQVCGALAHERCWTDNGFRVTVAGVPFTHLVRAHLTAADPRAMWGGIPADEMGRQADGEDA